MSWKPGSFPALNAGAIRGGWRMERVLPHGTPALLSLGQTKNVLCPLWRGLAATCPKGSAECETKTQPSPSGALGRKQHELKQPVITVPGLIQGQCFRHRVSLPLVGIWQHLVTFLVVTTRGGNRQRCHKYPTMPRMAPAVTLRIIQFKMSAAQG